MGRRKISIQPISEERNRKVTFVKRKAGLFKKAHELAILCQVDLAVIILGNNNSKLYEYSSVNSSELIDKFQDKRIVHEIKTPGDYGDYETKSRVRGAPGSRGDSSHTRNTSTNSFNMSIDEDEESEGEVGEDDEDEEEEEESKPEPKRRKKDTKPAKSKQQTKKSTSQPSSQQIPHAQPASLLPPPNVGAITSQQQAQQQQSQQQAQAPFQFYPQQPPQFMPNQQQHGTPQMIPQAYYSQEGFQSLPPQQQQLIQQQFARAQQAQPHPYPPHQFPFQVQNQYQQQQPQQQAIAQSQNHQSPFIKQDGATPGSSASTPVIQNSKPASINSPFTSNQRARSLNNNISTRPILRVQIPRGESEKDDRKIKNGDSANTVTAIETSKNDNSDNNNNNDNNSRNTDDKDSADGKDTSSINENKTPTTGSSKPDDNRPGLGILSNKSTPISATLPSGLFALPPPNPNPQYQNQFNNNINNGGANFKPPLNINTGEQTPLTGGLPSRYVPDLFPSPSNFYSNEWNIPFGSGNTPYPNSALPQGQGQLPNLAAGGGNIGGKFPKYSNLPNQEFNGPQSPLQNTPLSNQSKKKKDDGEKNYSGKKIKFEKPE